MEKRLGDDEGEAVCQVDYYCPKCLSCLGAKDPSPFCTWIFHLYHFPPELT